MKYSHLLALVAITSFFSCSEKSEQVAEVPLSYEWELVDSLDLEILGAPMLSDVNQDGTALLFFDYPSQKIITSDAIGNIKHSFFKGEDTPDSYGFMLESPGFYGEDQLAIFGGNGLFIFDLEGNMQKKIPHPESMGTLSSRSYIGKSLESTFFNERVFLLPTSVRPEKSFAGEQVFYDSYRALELIDVDDETMTEIIPFEKGSLFLNGKGFNPSDYTPAYEAKDETLYIVNGGDPQLYVYHLSHNGAALDTTIQLIIPNFLIPEGKDRAEFREGRVDNYGGIAAIKNIHILGNYLLLNFYGGRNPKMTKYIEALWLEGKEEEARALSQKIEEEVSKGTLVYDLADHTFLGNVPPPAKTGGRSYASGGGFAWFQKLPDPDVEEDFLRIYKMKLVAK